MSIYEELYGSNQWNGSVLSIMLLGGSVGAMLPTYMDTGKMTLLRRHGFLLLAESVSVITLLVAIYTWAITPTIAFLTIYFVSWQFVTVVTFAELAKGLHASDTLSRSTSKRLIVALNPMLEDEVYDQPSSEQVVDDDRSNPPYSIAVVSVVAANVVVQIIIQAVIFSGLQFNLRNAFWVIAYMNMFATILHGAYVAFRALT